MIEPLEACLSPALPAEECVARLQARALSSYAVHHPLLVALSCGDFSNLPCALRRFLREYYVYSRGFTRYLGGVMSSLECPTHRALLVGNTAEEAGMLDPEHEAELRAADIDPDDARAPHPELFRRFLRAVDLDPESLLIEPPHLATQAFCETIHDICRLGGEAQSIGAMGLATEGVVRPMYGQILRAIKRAWPSLPRRDHVFFDLHAAVDDDHAGVLRDIAASVAKSPEGRRNLALGMLKALHARTMFFDHMLAFLQQQDTRFDRAAA